MYLALVPIVSLPTDVDAIPFPSCLSQHDDAISALLLRTIVPDEHWWVGYSSFGGGALA